MLGVWIRPKLNGWFAPRLAANVAGAVSGGALSLSGLRGATAHGLAGSQGLQSLVFAMNDAGESTADAKWDADAYHRPVMLDEVVAALSPQAGMTIFDGTAGGGGHSEALLEAGARVIASDRDTAALAHARRRLQRFGDRFSACHGSFSEIRDWLGEAEVEFVDGILLDLGVSSRQLDDATRGFSFQNGGPLDMRMDRRVERSAADWVNEESEEELTRIFRDYGEERSARRVAAAIAKARVEKPIEATDELAAIVESVIPRHSGRHPATKVFQGLRIAVNDELGELEAGLKVALSCLKPGGRLVVISFHSLEDRLVKRFMRDHSRQELDRPEWPAPRPNPDWYFERKLPKSMAPGAAEIKANPRARSARLRVAVRRDSSIANG